MFEVTASLRMLADQGDAEARLLFLSLAKEIEAITDYTDGDETSHAREELYQAVVDFFPERVPGLYGELVSRQEWHRAERVAAMYAGRVAGDSTADRALLATFIAPAEFDDAWEAASRVDPRNLHLRGSLARLSGRDRPVPLRPP